MNSTCSSTSPPVVKKPRKWSASADSPETLWYSLTINPEAGIVRSQKIKGNMYPCCCSLRAAQAEKTSPLFTKSESVVLSTATQSRRKNGRLLNTSAEPYPQLRRIGDSVARVAPERAGTTFMLLKKILFLAMRRFPQVEQSREKAHSYFPRGLSSSRAPLPPHHGPRDLRSQEAKYPVDATCFFKLIAHVIMSTIRANVRYEKFDQEISFYRGRKIWKGR